MFPWNYFPFKKELNGMNPNDIENYVNDIIGKAFPENFQNLINDENNDTAFLNNKKRNTHSKRGIKELGYSIYDTHELVYVRIKLPQKEWINKIKVFYTSHQVIIENFPDQGSRQTITLPALVRKKGVSANYKDDMLEIKLPKRQDLQYSEIDITEL